MLFIKLSAIKPSDDFELDSSSFIHFCHVTTKHLEYIHLQLCSILNYIYYNIPIMYPVGLKLRSYVVSKLIDLGFVDLVRTYQ